MQDSKPAFPAVVTIRDYAVVSEEFHSLILNQMSR